jgi:PhnB protein
MKINPYLNFNGQCEEAFRFYQATLGGDVVLMTFGDSPMAAQMPADSHNRIMHARLSVGDAVLMGSDGPPQHDERPKGSYVSVNIAEPSEADRILNALAQDGAVQMPIAETFWAQRFGMVVDRFGTPWMVNCEKPGFFG